ncbi:MAG: SH3 domain-containing protein [Firmicutes bacterium]|nr:SH3 domain-containing protein [Bacillota bacterium]
MQKKALTTFYKLLILFAFILLMNIFAMQPLYTRTAFARQQIPVVPQQPFVWFEHSSVMLYTRENNVFVEKVLLPQTYFAEVTGEDGEFYSVIYYDLNGFIRKNAVTKVDFKPVTAFATSTLTATAVGDVSSINIRSRPNSISTIIGSAPVNSTLTFYGILSDNSPEGTNTTTSWYFVKFTNPNNQTAFGYIYSANAISNPIPNNNIQKVMTYVDPPPIFSPGTISFPPYITVIFIIVLSIPAVLIMLILFKKPKSDDYPKKTPRSL